MELLIVGMVQGSAVRCSTVFDFYGEFPNREPPNREPLNHARIMLHFPGVSKTFLMHWGRVSELNGFCKKAASGLSEPICAAALLA